MSDSYNVDTSSFDPSLDPNVQNYVNDPTFGGQVTDPTGGSIFDTSMFDPNFYQSSLGAPAGTTSFNPASPQSDYLAPQQQTAAAEVGGATGGTSPQVAAQQQRAASLTGRETPQEAQSRQIQIQQAATRGLEPLQQQRQPPGEELDPAKRVRNWLFGGGGSSAAAAPTGGVSTVAKTNPWQAMRNVPEPETGASFADRFNAATAGTPGTAAAPPPATTPETTAPPSWAETHPEVPWFGGKPAPSATPAAAPAPPATTPDQTTAANQPRGPQRRGNPLQELFRRLGLPPQLAQLAMLAAAGGMLGGGRGRRGGFLGMMPGMFGRGRGRFGRGGFRGGMGGFPGGRRGMMDPRALERFAGRQQGFPGGFQGGGNQFGGQDVNDILSSLFGGDQDQTGQTPAEAPEDGSRQAQPGPGEATHPAPGTAPGAPGAAPGAAGAAPGSWGAWNGQPTQPPAPPPIAPPGAPAGTAGAPYGTAPAAPGSPPGAPGWPLAANGLPQPSAAPYAPPEAQRQDAQAAAIGQANDAPAAILQGARQAAMLGNPFAVAQWMARNGHPRSGAWCGEFAAAVMRSQGLPTPRNPEVASNWRNWGRRVWMPRPGDVAVRNGAPTGSTGSHVAIVESADPRTGMMTVIGGNQGRIRSSRPMRGYSFQTFGAGQDGRPGMSTLYAHGVGG